MLKANIEKVINNFEIFCDKVSKGEDLLIIQQNGKNVVMISQTKYNELMEFKNNIE